MSVIPLDCVASTALMREALSAVIARMVTLWKQTNVHARLQVKRDTYYMYTRELHEESSMQLHIQNIIWL